MMNLQDAGILRVADKKLDFPKVTKAFKLVNEDVVMSKPNDISYVYNGLRPLSVSIIETLIAEKGLKNITNYIKTIGMPVTTPPADEADFWLKKNSNY